jgi:hypothetical protein
MKGNDYITLLNESINKKKEIAKNMKVNGKEEEQ